MIKATRPEFYQPLLWAVSLLLWALVLGLLTPSWGMMVDEETIREKVVAHVHQAIHPADSEELSVQVIQVPGAPFRMADLYVNPLSTTSSEESVVGREGEGLKIEASSPLTEQFSSRTIVKVKLTDAVGNIREVGVPVKITYKKPVWIVKNRIPAGKTLSALDVKLETRDVSRLAQAAVGQETDLKQYEARVNLQSGEILDARKIIQPPAVRRNNDVRIILSNRQGMHIVVSGKALQDGQVGETIRVYHQLYRAKTYLARVVDKNRVLVEL